MSDRTKLALHWKILIGLLAGLVFGLGVNLLWGESTWASMGVNDAKAFADSKTNSIGEPKPAAFRNAIRILRGESPPDDEQDRRVALNAAAWIVQGSLPDELGLSYEAEAQDARDRIDEALAEELDRLAELADKDIARDGTLRRPDALPTENWQPGIEQRVSDINADVIPSLAPNSEANAIAHTARFIRNANIFVGDLFLRLLKLIAVPIVLFSLVVGVASLNDSAKLGRIGGKTVGIYLVTTALAITVGLTFANVVAPGEGFPEELRDTLQADRAAEASEKIGKAEERPTPWEVALDIVPENPFYALANAKMLQVVFAALALGVALTLLPKEKADPVIAFFDTMTEVVIKIVEVVLRIAPYAVFALLVKVVADLGIDVLQSLVWYAMTVVLGLAVMMFGVYPLVLRIFTKVGYTRFFWAISPAQLLAFSSSSSGATMPVTLEVCEKRLGVKDEVTSFVVPVGATVNMDGTALYQAVAALFIAQLYGFDITLADQLTIVLTATLASIGTAAVPGVGIVMLVIVLTALGWPLEGIAVILGVDRILDMCRTSCNVTGDCMVCAVVGTSENEILSASEVDRLLAQEEAHGLDEHPPGT